MAKRTVEECLILDVAELVRPSLGYPGFFGWGPLRQGKERLGLVRYLLTEDWLEVFCPFGTPPHEFSLNRLLKKSPPQPSDYLISLSC